MTLKASAILLFVGSIWGASFLFIRVAVDEVSPIETTFCRTLFGAVTLVAIVVVQRRPVVLSLRRIGTALLLTVVGTIAPFVMISWAETELESGPASVLNATMPLFTILFAALVLPEDRLTVRALLGVLLGLGGVIVLSGSGPSDLGDSHVLAQGAVVLASACYGASAIAVRLLLRTWDPVVLSMLQIAQAALVTGVIAGALGPTDLSPSADVVLSLVALGVLGTGAAYVAYYWLIENVGAVRSSLVTYIIPVVGVTLGAIVLDERVLWNTFVGGVVIVLGVGVGTGGLERLLAYLGGGRRQQPVGPSR